MGFNVALSQLLTAPPYAGSAIVMFLCAWLGDKYHVRGPLLLFTAALGLLGLPLLGWSITSVPSTSAASSSVRPPTAESQPFSPTRPTIFAASGSARLHLRLLSVSAASVASRAAPSSARRICRTTARAS